MTDAEKIKVLQAGLRECWIKEQCVANGEPYPEGEHAKDLREAMTVVDASQQGPAHSFHCPQCGTQFDPSEYPINRADTTPLEKPEPGTLADKLQRAHQSVFADKSSATLNIRLPNRYPVPDAAEEKP